MHSKNTSDVTVNEDTKAAVEAGKDIENMAKDGTGMDTVIVARDIPDLLNEITLVDNGRDPAPLVEIEIENTTVPVGTAAILPRIVTAGDMIETMTISDGEKKTLGGEASR